MSIFFNYNDTLYPEGSLVISPDSRSLKYGDGLFETIKVINGRVQLRDYHFERLFAGMQALQFDIPEHYTAAWFEDKITTLCKMNQHDPCVRVRLTVLRGNGGLFDHEHNTSRNFSFRRNDAEDNTSRDFSFRRNDAEDSASRDFSFRRNDDEDHVPHYIIQTWNMENSGQLNTNGLATDIYPEARKSCDGFANYKTNNYLPYAMAARYAQQIKVDDCIVLNTYGRICDTTIANIFIIKDDVIYTPALSEGCIAGVMRRFVIEKLNQSNFNVTEKPLSIEELENADEVFLTNSVRGIRWVKQFRNSLYSNNLVQEIHKI